jgi:homocitrate synthase
MVEVSLTNATQNANGEGRRGTPRNLRAEMDRQKLNPYAPRASDFLSNISNFNIIESTLRGIYFVHLIMSPLKNFV